jgi:hypothetical protein
MGFVPGGGLLHTKGYSGPRGFLDSGMTKALRHQFKSTIPWMLAFEPVKFVQVPFVQTLGQRANFVYLPVLLPLLYLM